MSPSFVVAMFLALIMVAYWRITLAMFVAFVLAALLVGTGLVDIDAKPTTRTTLEPAGPEPPPSAAGGSGG